MLASPAEVPVSSMGTRRESTLHAHGLNCMQGRRRLHAAPGRRGICSTAKSEGALTTNPRSRHARIPWQAAQWRLGCRRSGLEQGQDQGQAAKQIRAGPGI